MLERIRLATRLTRWNPGPALAGHRGECRDGVGDADGPEFRERDRHRLDDFAGYRRFVLALHDTDPRQRHVQLG